MAVSLFFSLNLYRISTREVGNRLRNQAELFSTRATPFGQVLEVRPLEQENQEQLHATRRQVLGDLVYSNFLILVLGGIGSYLLAKRTIKPIQESHEAQARFTADASHELRTPIAAMRAETEVALRDPKLKLKEARHLLRSNVEELESLSVLTDGLLVLAGGNGHDMGEKVALNQIIESALKQTAHAAKQKTVKIEVAKPPKAYLRGNQTRLVQAVVILLDNAIKYSPSKTTVSLRTKVGSSLQIAVSDQGHGISPADLEHVFERFYRVDKSRSHAEVGGHGLGLSIAQQIAQAHDGHIAATSTLGKGSVFTIHLPPYKS